jgi:hypothetical protein
MQPLPYALAPARAGRGNTASVLRVVPYAAVHFASYEWFRRCLYAGATDLRAPGSAQSRRSSSGGGGGGRPSPVLDLLAGAASGAVAVLATYPLDLVRTQMAYATGSPPPGGARMRFYIGRCLQQDGVRGLYRGVAPTLVGILPYAGLKFYFFSLFKEAWRGRAAEGAALAGATAASNGGEGGGWESDGGRASSGSGASGGAISGGAVGSTRGASGRGDRSGDGSRESPGTGPSAEPTLTSGRLPVGTMLMFGGVSGLAAQTLTYPLDVVRRHMQVSGLEAPAPGSAQVYFGGAAGARPPPRPARLTILATARHILQESGLRGFGRGLTINFLKVVPSTAIGFTVYEGIKELLGLQTV